MKKQNLKCAVRYPVLHFEKKAAPVEIYKVLAEQLAARGFPFKKPRSPFSLRLVSVQLLDLGHHFLYGL